MSTHPFRGWGVWEFDDEHPEGWPICGDCGEAQDDLSHGGFIPLGAMSTDDLLPDDTHWYDQGGVIPPGLTRVRNDTGTGITVTPRDATGL